MSIIYIGRLAAVFGFLFFFFFFGGLMSLMPFMWIFVTSLTIYFIVTRSIGSKG